MADNNYFWQGGKKIPIEQTESKITVQAPDKQAAKALAAEAGVALDSMEQISPTLVRAAVPENRDAAMAELRSADNVVHHVYRTPDEPEAEYFITDTFFIKFKTGTLLQTIADYLKEEHLEVIQELGNNTLQVKVTTETGRNPIKTANLAAERPEVEYAEPNLVRTLQRFDFIPADTLFQKQWHLYAPADEAPDLRANAGISAPDAWEVTEGSREIVICVADDGFNLTHPDFDGTNKIKGKLNALGGNGIISFNEDVLPKPGDYHGTPCAGVAIAEINGQGTVGVAPGCAFLAVRFPLSFDDASMIKLFDRISLEADVVSCSWGVGPANAPMSTAFYERIALLAGTGGKRGKGLVICVAAGNNNCPVKDLNNTRTYEYLRDGLIHRYSGPIDRWIAAHPDVITVSGCTSLLTRSCYSSWGKEISICAPTDNWDDLRRILPIGRGIVTTDNEGFGNSTDFTTGSRYTSKFGGTSSATPTVAGVCGLILSRNPNLTAAQVKQIIEDTADKDLIISSETAVNEPGDFLNGFSLWFGHGKVNAAKAVQAAAPDTEITLSKKVKAKLKIPDNGKSIYSTLTITQEGQLSDLKIEIDISHTYVSDLRIDLTAPNGASVTLHNHAGNSADDIRKVYTVAEVPALRAFLGKSVKGTWTLRVMDTVRMDSGKLNSWSFMAMLTA